MIVVESDAVDSAIESALDEVPRFFDADRCALCVVSDDQALVHFSHISIGEGVSNTLGDLNLAVLFPWVAQRV